MQSTNLLNANCLRIMCLVAVDTRAEVDQANGLSLNVHAKEFVTMKQGMVHSSRWE